MSTIQSHEATSPTFVISRTEKGFKVYAAENPAAIYVVTGGPDFAVCSCPEFESGWKCLHIEAVLKKLKPWSGNGSQNGNSSGQNGEAAAATRAPRSRSRNQAKVVNGTADGIDQMQLKRSVSPDGRIDSLSIEFTCTVDRTAQDEIRARALGALKLQSDIAAVFLGRSGNGQQASKPKEQPANGSHGIEARLLRVGGMDGKYGRRLFITVQANGDRLRFFGSRKELARAIEVAGFGDRADDLDEGTELELPCRVITEPSSDGRYINVKRILPAGNGRS